MSILTRINKIRTGNPHPVFYVTMAISVLALGAAFFTEYVLGYPPCKLCVYQRWPFVILIKISLSGLIATKFHRFWLACAAFTIVVAIGIAGYHAGIEHHLFDASTTCNPEMQMPDNMSIDEIKNMLYSKPIATCTKAPFKVLMLSMTEWNLLLNLGLFVLVVLSFSQKVSNMMKHYAKAIF